MILLRASFWGRGPLGYFRVKVRQRPPVREVRDHPSSRGWSGLLEATAWSMIDYDTELRAKGSRRRQARRTILQSCYDVGLRIWKFAKMESKASLWIKNGLRMVGQAFVIIAIILPWILCCWPLYFPAGSGIGRTPRLPIRRPTYRRRTIMTWRPMRTPRGSGGTSAILGGRTATASGSAPAHQAKSKKAGRPSSSSAIHSRRQWDRVTRRALRD